jgi:hypothetical protein
MASQQRKKLAFIGTANLGPSAPVIAGGRAKNGSSLASKDELAGTGKAKLPV